MKLSVLAENTAQGHLIAEHGFSVLIENESGDRVLFDTGQGMALEYNSPRMGIDLTEIDNLLISHGHYDHTGGIDYLADIPRNGRKLRIHMHPSVLEQKMIRREPMVYDYIGIPCNPAILNGRSISAVMSTNPVEVVPGVTLTGEVPRDNEFERVPDSFCRVTPGDNGFVRDELLDDQSVILDIHDGFVLLCACCHSGVINTINHARSISGKKPLAVVGGLHLVGADDSRIQATIDALDQIGVRRFFLGHCTGRAALRAFEDAFGDGVASLRVGDRLDLTELCS